MLTTVGALAIAVVGGYTSFILWGAPRLDNIEAIPQIEQRLGTLSTEHIPKLEEDIQKVAGALQQVQQYNLFQIWKNLDNLRKTTGLSPEDHAQWCTLGQQLKTVTTPCPSWKAGPQG